MWLLHVFSVLSACISVAADAALLRRLPTTPTNRLLCRFSSLHAPPVLPPPLPPKLTKQTGSTQVLTSTSDVPGLLLWDIRSGKVERSIDTPGPVGSMDVSVVEGVGGLGLPTMQGVACCAVASWDVTC